MNAGYNNVPVHILIALRTSHAPTAVNNLERNYEVLSKNKTSVNYEQ